MRTVRYFLAPSDSALKENTSTSVSPVTAKVNLKMKLICPELLLRVSPRAVDKALKGSSCKPDGKSNSLNIPKFDWMLYIHIHARWRTSWGTIVPKLAIIMNLL